MEPTQIQSDIISHDGHTVVLASPGSGKTFVIAEKIKRLLGNDDMPEYQGVIAISYTRKASGNLKKRTLREGVPVKNSFFGTIDSFCLTQIILPFGNYVWGYTSEDIIPIDENDLPADKKDDYAWLKDKPDYDEIEEERWDGLRALFSEGKVLIRSLELLALMILKECRACRNYVKARYKYVFIDEFQDADTYTNGIFHELIGIGLIGNAVGDVNQSIFGFDKKSSEYLEELQTAPGFERFCLDTNFRCSKSIINYSNRLLNANSTLLDTDEDGVKLVQVNGDESNVADYLDNAIPEDCERWQVEDFGEVAILVKRIETQALIDEHLDTPHRVVLTTCLDNDLNPWSRLFALLLQFYFDERMSFLSVIEEFDDYDMMTKKDRLRLKQLKEEIRTVDDEEIGDELPRLFKQIAKMILSRYDEGTSFKRLEDVLGNRQLLDTYRPLTGEEVVIMTLHKAKGLEFDLVYHLNMNEWELPIKLPRNRDWNDLYYLDEVQDLDLHYVGVTRAKKACTLITNTSRHSNGNVKKGSPSEFLTRNGVQTLRNDYTYGF
jgi:DNA helicase-2/ATP-dependent DNA helicase PcrA